MYMRASPSCPRAPRAAAWRPTPSSTSLTLHSYIFIYFFVYFYVCIYIYIYI